MNSTLFKVALLSLITICLSVCYNPSNANTTSGLEIESSIACEIFNLTATPEPCTPNNVFFVVIDFDVAGDPSDSFTVGGNGNDYGTFNYNELPVTVGPLEGDGSTEYEFVVTDSEDPECTDFVVIDPVDCESQGNCEIFDLVVDPLECNDDGTYNILINFEYTNAPNDLFDVFDENNVIIGTYALVDLPVTHNNFVPSGNDFDLITVCINDTPDCCATQEFMALDCPPAECLISNLVADLGPCDGMLFWVTINFDYENTGDLFSVQGNGDDYGEFNYNELPVTVGPFVGDGSTIYELVVTDLENPDCSDFTEFEAIQCSSNACEIWDLIAEAHACDDNGQFLLDIDFNYQNTSDSFEVIGNSNNYGTFAYADLFITLGPFDGNGQIMEFVVFDQQDDGCNAATEIEAPTCNNNACEIWDLIAEPSDCNDDGQFFVDIDFNYQNTSDSFTVIGNGDNYGTFAYADLFITLGPFDGNGQIMEFLVFDQQDDGCSAAIEIEAPNCNNNACEIWDLIAEAHACDDNGQFLLDIDFNYQNTSDSFEVHGDGNNYGTFAYADLFITLGPFDGNGQIMEFIVFDQQDDGCSAAIEIEAPNCNNNACEIWDLIAEAHACDDNGQFLLDIDFNYQNTSDSFEVHGDGNNYGTFAYADLFITLGPFDGNGQIMEFIVFDQQDDGCSAATEIEAPTCNNNACEIWDLIAELSDCNDDGQFFVDIDFNYQNTSDSFTVIGNGDNYGTFAYADLFITLGPFDGNGQIMEFLVFDQQDDGCSAATEIEAPNCNNNACEIWDLIAEAHACDDNGQFLLDIDFNYQNTSDSFEVHGNGNNYGTFAYADLFITLGPFDGNGQIMEFVVFDQQDDGCSAAIEIEAPNCNNNACEIWDLIAEAHACNDDDQFFVDIDFNYQNTSDSFEVHGNGNNYGTFAYADLFITLGPFDGNGQIMEFVVFDQEEDGCNAEIVIEAPNCGVSGDCSITELVVDPLECNDDGTYSILINFQYENPGNDFFDLFDGDGNSLGFYPLSDLPLTYPNFIPSGNDFDVITVCINDMPDCCATAEFEALDCPGSDCEIWDLIAEVSDCNDNDQFFVDIDFNYSNTSDSFEVHGNGNNYGTFAYADLFITLGPFDGNGQIMEFIVFDQQDDGCSAAIEIEAPNCNNNACEIWDLIAEAHACDDNGQFLIDIDFNYQNTSDSFEVHGNGNNYGTFAYADLFITLGPFDGNGQIMEFVVIDQEEDGCSAEIVIEAPNCGGSGDCSITELVVDPLECNDDGTYSILINFQYENPGNDFFDLFDGDGNSLGFYPLSDLPLTYPNFIPSGNDFDVITVCINDMPDCCATAEFEALDCPGSDCEIWDLIAEVSDCNDNDQFFVDIDFNYSNTSDSFEVHGNGNNYGTFAYADLFITLGPFDGNGQIMEFVVYDQQNDGCAEDIVIEAPNCGGSSNCEIWDLMVDPLECNDDGTYSIAINFQYENPGNDYFEVFDANGDLIDFFLLADLPVVIQNFVPSGNDYDLITVCINDMPDCCATTEFEALDCEEACQIYDLVAEVFCDGDELWVEFNFEYSGVGDFFDVLACDYLATFAYGTNNYLIQIPDDQVNCAGGIFFPFAVFDQENDACGDAIEIEIPDCYNTGCVIGDIEADVSDCENGEFYVTIDFDYQDVSDEGFSVFGDGNDYGEFEYSQLPITLGPFTANGQEMEFIIVDLVVDDCWNFTEIEAPFCTDEANTCIEFEGLYNGVNYGGPNSEIGDLLLIENGVYVTIEGVMDPLGNLNDDYLFATNQDICTPFEMASGIRMFMFNGLRFNFTDLDENPSIVVFNYHNCGVPFAISANDQEPVTYVLPENDYSLALTPSVMVHFDVNENNSEEGIATFEGDIQSIFTGGIEFQIDNVCFNVDDPFTDVWPGDANYDNLASHFDLLNVGIAFSSEGTDRDVISNDWFAMPSANWDDEFINEANYKHADCNGDGIVNFDDQVAIEENYGLTHGEVPIFVPVEGTENDPVLFVDLPESSEIVLNQTFEAPIVLGTVEIPVEEIYGLAFTIEFDADMMDETQVHVELGSSWLGVNGESLITIDKKFANDGIIEVALVRNNQSNIGGQGNIGYFIGIIDDILGKSDVEVKIKKVKAIELNESPIPLNTPTEIVGIPTGTGPTLIEADLEVFPNPTDDFVNIHYNGAEIVHTIKIFNTLGQLVTEFTDPGPQQKVDVSDWSAGIYIAKIEIGDTTICKKIKVTRL